MCSNDTYPAHTCVTHEYRNVFNELPETDSGGGTPLPSGETSIESAALDLQTKRESTPVRKGRRTTAITRAPRRGNHPNDEIVLFGAGGNKYHGH